MCSSTRRVRWGSCCRGPGFALLNLETGPYGLEPAPINENVVKLLTEKGFDTALRGETMHVLGQKVGPVIERYPKWLYD